MLSLAQTIRNRAVKRVYLGRSYERYKKTITGCSVLGIWWRTGFEPGVSVVSSPFLSL